MVRAAALNPAGNSFHLSDSQLVVVHRPAVQKGINRKRNRASCDKAEAAAVVMTTYAGGGSDDESAGGVTSDQLQVVGLVACKCETDIFNALGLQYVPPHMRNIT
jgi:hypothetical protein